MKNINKNDGMKAFNIRLPKDLWNKVKKNAVDHEISMNKIIVDLLSDYIKKSSKNKLTRNDAMV